MISLIILIGIFSALFALSFASKRRFGILGLAVTAGWAISGLWAYDAGLLISGLGIISDRQLLDAVVSGLLILLPAIVLCFTGYKYKSVVSRSVGSMLFALFAVAFLLTPIGSVLPVEGLGADVFRWLTANRDWLVSAGVVCAVVDLFLRKSTPPPDASGKKKK